MMLNDKSKNCRGNAMVYVLVALALLGFLTVTLSRQNNQSDGQDITDEVAELYANELIEYTSSAQYAIELMLSTGTEINDLNFVKPDEAGFETGSHIHKVFHPQGGGLNHKFNISEDIVDSSGSPPGWYFDNLDNVEWTPTTANDVILSALRIKKSICEKINQKIIGSKTIPPLTAGLGALFDPSAGSPTELDNTVCPACDGYPALCVENPAGTYYGFYSIIAAQ